MDNNEARFIVELYLDCRESRVLPMPGSLMEQTSFTFDIFNFLDSSVAEWKEAEHKKAMDKIKKE